MTTNIQTLKQAGWTVEVINSAYVPSHPNARAEIGFKTEQQAWDYAQRTYDNYPMTRTATRGH